MGIRNFSALGFQNRIISFMFIVISASLLLGSSVFYDRLNGRLEVFDNHESADKDVYIYSKEVPELKIKPFFTDDREFCLLIPFTDKSWAWYVPQGASLSIDGTSYNTGDDMRHYDENDKHSFIFIQDGVTAEWYMECIYADDMPVVSISLDENDWISINSEELPSTKFEADLTLVNQDGTVGFNGLCRMGGHGNATWLKCKKKSYEIKLFNEVSLLDMGRSKGWNIIANAMDPSNLKNMIVYEAARESGYEYSVGCSYINLYVNGMYYGLYLLTEKPVAGGCITFTDDLEKDNIKMSTSEDYTPVLKNKGTNDEIRYYDMNSNPVNISGSYLLEFDRYDETLDESSDESWFMTEKATDIGSCGYQVLIKQPKIATESELMYIKNYVRNAENAIYSKNGIDPESGVNFRDCIDIYSWGMTYLFMDFFAYQDYSAGSLFFYKKRNDDLLYSGPVWDYDKCMTDDYYSEEPFPWYEKNDIYLWYERMGHFDDFHDQVVRNYCSELSPILQNIIDNELPGWRKIIAPSEKMDEIRWRMDQGYESYRGDLVQDWLIRRKDLFDSVWIRGEKSSYADNVY